MADDTNVSLATIQLLAGTPTFIQNNLISDGSEKALVTDPNLINPWGVSFSPTGPFWISDAGKGLTSVDSVKDGAVTLNVLPPITIASPTPGGQSVPTGQVFNSFGTTDPTAFMLANGKPAVFLFATVQGTIAGWNADYGTNAPTIINNSAAPVPGYPTQGAAYTGLAIGNSSNGPTLYAANFAQGKVDVFDSKFASVNSFSDPQAFPNYAPFNVQVLNDKLYVAYAQKDSQTGRDVPGTGHGFVDTFTLDGKFVDRIAAGGSLDSPWGLAIAPTSWQGLAGDLLVGNFGDGTINAYDLATKTFEGQLSGKDGKPLVNDNLWALTPGNGASAGRVDSIYLTAGLNNEEHGLFASIAPVVVTPV